MPPSQHKLILEGPGLRNAFYAGVLKSFQDASLPLPKSTIAWSGGVPLAVGLLLGLDMQELHTWSLNTFPTGFLTPKKTRTMYEKFCDRIYRNFSHEEVRKKLSTLKILCTERQTMATHVIENFSGERTELLQAMIASAGIPGITLGFGASFIDFCFARDRQKTIAELTYIPENIFLSVTKKPWSTIYLEEASPVWRRWIQWIELFHHDPQKSQHIFNLGLTAGSAYMKPHAYQGISDFSEDSVKLSGLFS